LAAAQTGAAMGSGKRGVSSGRAAVEMNGRGRSLVKLVTGVEAALSVSCSPTSSCRSDASPSQERGRLADGAIILPTRPRAAVIARCHCCGSLAPSHAEWDESSVEGPSPSETGEEERQTVERPEKDHRAQGGSSALARIASAHIASAHSQTSSLPASTSSHSTTPASSICAPRTPRSSPPPTPTHPLTKMCRIP